MTNVIQLNKYRDSFTIKVVYDSDGMEVVELKYPKKFKNLNSLAKADILKDISYLTDVDREQQFDNYTQSITNEKKK
jgi:hypothetical protein|tara:strand:+ start:393 stop:623 length:231 start_codon:yes stop_codon:yes gene_type:complete